MQTLQTESQSVPLAHSTPLAASAMQHSEPLFGPSLVHLPLVASDTHASVLLAPLLAPLEPDELELPDELGVPLELDPFPEPLDEQAVTEKSARTRETAATFEFKGSLQEKDVVPS